ncbi:DUF1801 domain-containing protein [Micromonospora sediminicola]|uniref:iron chaperone n=1 Tax=Micromonospora sediminicola TaxID=946078 RepID=UPI00340658C9
MAEHFATIDDYIASCPPPVQTRLRKIRKTIMSAAPGSKQGIKYNMPTIMLDDLPLVHFAAWKHHIALYPIPESDASFAKAVAPYRGDKDAAKFPHGDDLPLELIERITKILLKQRAENSRH